MKKQRKKTAKMLAISMFAVGFVTPLMFSNIAEAANYGAGGTAALYSDAQLNTFSAKNSSCTKIDLTTWTHNIQDSNCVMINGYRFKVVKTEAGTGTYAGKQILTLWSYNSTQTGATKSFATDLQYDADGEWSNDAGTSVSAAEAYNHSYLKTAMDGLLTIDSTTGKPNGGKLYDSNLTYVKYTSTTDSNVTDAYVWAPSRTEVKGDTGNTPPGTEAAGTWGLTSDAQRAFGDISWLRSPYPDSDYRAYYVSGTGNLNYTRVDSDVGLLRPALQILNQTSCVFTTNVAIPTDGMFKADKSDGTNYAPYALNSTAAIVPTFTPATDGVILDGTKIGINATDKSSGTYAMAGLLTEEADSAKNDTWANLNGPSATSTKGISYMAQVSSNELDLSGVATDTDYTLKVFGLKTADTTVTQLADNAVQGLSKGSDSKIHMVVSGTVNAGVPVTVSNGAVVDFGGGDLTAKLDFKSGGNLAVNGQLNFGTNGVVEQAAGSNITVAASLIEADTNDPAKAMFTGVDDATKLDVSAGNLTLTGTIQEGKYYVLVAGNAVDGSTLTADNLWNIDNITVDGMLNVEYVTNLTGNSIAIQIINATSNEEGITSGLAAVQQGNISVAKEFTDEVANRLSFVQRPSLKAVKVEARDVASTNKDEYSIEPVEQGNANEVMPVQVADKDKYDKEVWASYIRTKETTEGMKLGAGVKGNNTAQYNGAVVGVDFYSSDKAIVGMALGYVDGNINSHSGDTSTKNDAKYYGVSFYDRVINGNNALIYDIGYIKGDNDISQFNNDNETTADVKTDTYTAGVRYEAEFGTKESRVVPFASFRYMRQNNKDYTNSHGTRFESSNQNLYIPKVGIAWTGDFIMPQSVWTWRPSVEAGYVWNLGDRSVDGNVFMGGSVAGIEYDTVDKSSYYAKAGMEFMCKNFTAGVFYRYLKGSTVRNNKWNVNVAWSF